MQNLGASPLVQGATPAPRSSAPKENRPSKLARWFDSWMRSLGMALVLFLVIKTFLIEAFQIPSGSMENTLLPGDFLFVNKAVYGAEIPGTTARMPGFQRPQRGDVIVFAYPRDPTINYVKRVIGLPGDTVEMRGGRVEVDGRALPEPYVRRIDQAHDLYDSEFSWQGTYFAGAPDDPLRLHPTRDNWGPLLVPSGKYLVLGDNRDNSSDSRYWGFVGEEAVRGRPLVVYFSYDREAPDAIPWLTDIRWRRLGSLIR